MKIARKKKSSGNLEPSQPIPPHAQQLQPQNIPLEVDLTQDSPKNDANTQVNLKFLNLNSKAVVLICQCGNDMYECVTAKACSVQLMRLFDIIQDDAKASLPEQDQQGQKSGEVRGKTLWLVICLNR